jgi:hypothetical protein
VTRLTERLVEAHHADAAEFIHLMSMGGSSAIGMSAKQTLHTMIDDETREV